MTGDPRSVAKDPDCCFTVVYRDVTSLVVFYDTRFLMNLGLTLGSLPPPTIRTNSSHTLEHKLECPWPGQGKIVGENSGQIYDGRDVRKDRGTHK